ncbi:HAD family hydrolase [Calothrix rhizosoleniae]|uniref:HAD family hydrolase n=2 Tax=Calothrix rhizosoleniae TaxID=888997 RepID=UPI000B49AB12|nr:HAD family hydrolase [Calothrix rhizosoleniae]
MRMNLLDIFVIQREEIKIDSQKIKAVIFDVDGTLYHLKKIYNMVRLEIINYYLRNPGKVGDIQIITDFMREREKHALDVVDDVENAQYEWAAKKTHSSPEKVRQVVDKWIFQVPLKYMYHCRRTDVLELFHKLIINGIATGVFSDYPAAAKLEKLGLFPQCIVSATDKNVGKLKPDPKGLLIAADILGVAVEDCLLIGDRDDRDGECARQAGMPYLILD